jgi:hypothetical protein
MWHLWGAGEVLVRKPEGKTSLARYRHRFEDNIKVYLTEMRWCDVDGIGVLQDEDSGGLFCTR